MGIYYLIKCKIVLTYKSEEIVAIHLYKWHVMSHPHHIKQSLRLRKMYYYKYLRKLVHEATAEFTRETTLFSNCYCPVFIIVWLKTSSGEHCASSICPKVG